MPERYYQTRAALLAAAYRGLLRPIFFRIDPERIHDRMVASGVQLGKTRLGRALTRAAFSYQHPMLEQDLAGIHFANPIGLAAGFDKNAQLTDILPSVGFGFIEVGSITGEPCAGNPKPRLQRLPRSKSLRVYYGLKNDGCEAITTRLKDKRFAIPVGMSVAKTNNQATCDTDRGIQDYAKAFRHVAGSRGLHHDQHQLP